MYRRKAVPAVHHSELDRPPEDRQDPACRPVRGSADLSTSSGSASSDPVPPSAVFETPFEPGIEHTVLETPAEPSADHIVPCQEDRGLFPVPVPPTLVLPEEFFRDGPWRFPLQRIRVGQLFCDIILLQDSR